MAQIAIQGHIPAVGCGVEGCFFERDRLNVTTLLEPYFFMSEYKYSTLAVHAGQHPIR